MTKRPLCAGRQSRWLKSAVEPDILVRRFGIKGLLTCMTADYRECLAAARQVKALALASGDVYLIMIFNNLESVALLHLGEWRQLRANMDAALAMTEKNANRPGSAMGRLMSAWLHAEAQDFPGALDLCGQAGDTALDAIPLIFFVRRIVLGKAYVGLGDLGAAARQYEEMLARIAVNATGTDYSVDTQILAGHCAYLIAAGDLGQARQQANRLFDLARPAPDRNNLALAYWYLARIAEAEGNLAEAGSHLYEAVTLLDGAELPHTAWRVYQAAARFHARAGDAGNAADFSSRRDRAIAVLASNFDAADPMRLALEAAGSGQ